MDDEEKAWQKKSLETLKYYYLSFEGTQWHEFNRSTDTDLLRAKICFALFGPPTNDAIDIENAYNDEQRKRSQEILDIILNIYKDAPVSSLRVGFVFVSCKQEEKEFALPIFSVYVGTDKDGKDMRNFVDTQGRTYKNWDDWKNNNCLPKLRYAYPKHGYFTCDKNGSYDFNSERDPVIEYGTSPQSSIASGILTGADIGASIVSLGCGIVGVASLFTPVAPAVLTAAAVAGTSTAVYGASRGIGSLIDKGTHGQSLTDLESLTIWFSIIATPLHFASSAVNGTLAMGARQGRIFSSSMRTLSTILNFTTLGLDSVLFSFSLVNLIKKAVNEEVTSLDILQFSMSAFFFTHTLIQPKVAGTIIRQAQQMHFDQMANSITDADAKQAFNKFLQENKSRGSITDRSKIVRTINRMNDPGKFFKATGPDATIKIGGRKGKTCMVSDQHGYTTRVRPNEFNGMFTSNSSVPGAYKFKKDYKRLQKCYDKLPEDVELNRVKIFKNLSDRQKRSISRTIGGTARSNQQLILTAHGIAEKMGYKTADELLSVIEIVAKQVEGKSGTALSDALSHIQTGPGRNQFINDIRTDLTKAMECARRGGLNFDNPLTAVYHYRKHGAEFPDLIKRFGNTLDVYLGPVRNRVFDATNLREVCTLQDGTVRHIYASNNDEFGVITSTPAGAKTSTMFRKPGVSSDYAQKLADFFRDHVHQSPPELVSQAAERLAKSLGFRAFHVIVSVDGTKQPIDECLNLDASVHDKIAQLLVALADA